MKTKLFLLNLLLIFSIGFVQAQQILIQCPKTNYQRTDLIDKKFVKYELVKLDLKAFNEALAKKKDNIYNVMLSTEKMRVQMTLFEYSMFNDNFGGVWHAPFGVIRSERDKSLRTFRGAVKEDYSGRSAMTCSKDFFMLNFRYNNEDYSLEKLHGDLNPNNEDIYILYGSSDVLLSNEAKVCGADYLKENQAKMREEHDHSVGSRNTKCLDVEIGLACDYSYVKALRGFNVQDFMTAICNYMATNWDNDFPGPINFAISGYYIPQDSLSDVFNRNTDINDQLNNFVAQGANILPDHDVATCWSAKWTSGVVGLAYLGGTCTGLKYNVCSQYTFDFACLRQLQSHELGHNFNATHDATSGGGGGGGPTGGGGNIMAPAVNCSNSWSPNSVRQIWLFATESAPCLSECVGIDPIPVVEFEANPTRMCSPGLINFTEQTQYANYWSWYFPGGVPSSSTNPNPVVTYPNPGKYLVSLTVRNSRCTLSLIKDLYIEIDPSPIPDFAPDIQSLDVYFLNLTTNAYDYFWDFGDGATSTEFDPTHTYKKEGDYTVTLKVTGDCGTRTLTKKIEVYYVPVADFESDTIYGCAPKTIQFFDRSSDNVVRWDWRFPGGTPNFSTQKNPKIVYKNKGIYDVKLFVEAKRYGASAEKKLYIKIDSAPIAKFDLTITGSDVQFNNKSTYAETHNWDFGDNSTSTDESPSHTYKDGIYEVTYTTTNNCGTHTYKRQVIIGNEPKAAFSSANARGCAPWSVQFDNNSTAAATNFLWTFPGGNPSTSTAKNPLVTYNQPGKYDVSLLAYNAVYRDSVTINEFVEILNPAVPDFKTSVTGFTAYFSNQSQYGNSYFWDFGDNNTSTQQAPSHNYGQEGEFKVKLTVTNECGQKTIEKTVAVYLIPKVNFSSDTIKGCRPLTIHFKDLSSSDVIEWNWQFENGKPASSTEQNPVVVFDKSGSFTVKLTVKNGNGTNSSTKLKYIQVINDVYCKYRRDPKDPNSDGTVKGAGLQSIIAEKSIELYPNPNNGQFVINLTNFDLAQSKIKLFDMTGKLVYQSTSAQPQNQIHVEQLSNGTYLLMIQEGAESYFEKVFITK
ncbi:MAG TPA: PKD domain-containing protein [Saprospiraceae bacterium]|nr:PKD domain-containing protein [Saprospiraceae bacterium]